MRNASFSSKVSEELELDESDIQDMKKVVGEAGGIKDARTQSKRVKILLI